MQPRRSKNVFPKWLNKYLNKLFSRNLSSQSLQKSIVDTNIVIDFYPGTNIRDVDFLKYKKGQQIHESDILAFSYAEPGAMGCPCQVIVMLTSMEIYYFNLLELTDEDIYKIMPILHECKFGYDNAADLPSGFSHYYIGLGNHLAIKNTIHLSSVEDKQPIELFKEFYLRRGSHRGDWIMIINDILQDGIDDFINSSKDIRGGCNDIFINIS